MNTYSYTCQSGMVVENTLNPVATITCGSDGSWSALPTCECKDTLSKMLKSYIPSLSQSGKYCVTAPDAKTGFTNNFVPNSPNYYVVDMVQVTYTCTSPNAKFVTNENLNWINVPCRTADTWEYSDPWPECVEFTVCTETPPAPEAGMHNDYNPSNEIRNDHWIRLVKKGYLS